MRASELQAILQNNKKYSVTEIQNIIQELIHDGIGEINEHFNEQNTVRWYQGEINGFYICRDLLDHLESEVKL
jgi:hypothetical protein